MAAQGTGAPAAEAKEGPRRPLNYAELSKDSLRAVTMENGLQQSAIYWETGHRTWLPFWASFTQKFTWKIIDDQIRRFLGFTSPVTTEPFIFYNSPHIYMRQYVGDPDVHLTVPLSVRWRFAFSPAGTETFEDYDKQVQDAFYERAVSADQRREKQRAVDAILKCAEEADKR